MFPRSISNGMDTLEKLVAFFSRFPGIGPRQARRFSYFLLRAPTSSLEEFTALVKDLKKSIGSCESCRRFFSRHGNETRCTLCTDKNRSDADGEASLALLRMAGVDTDNVEYIGPGQTKKGAINIDTGNKHGIVASLEDRTAYFDHHSVESKNTT